MFSYHKSLAPVSITKYHSREVESHLTPSKVSLVSIPTITVSNSEVPLAAYFKILELYELGFNEAQIVECYIRLTQEHRKRRTFTDGHSHDKERSESSVALTQRQIVKDVVSQVIDNQIRIRIAEAEHVQPRGDGLRRRNHVRRTCRSPILTADTQDDKDVYEGGPVSRRQNGDCGLANVNVTGPRAILSFEEAEKNGLVCEAMALMAEPARGIDRGTTPATTQGRCYSKTKI